MNGELYDKSVNSVRNAINQKLNYAIPYYGRNNTVRNMVTDMDQFPYNRFFRGKYNSEQPIIFDREAGWRLRNDNCYKGVLGWAEPQYPNHCFEAPCSTVYPCFGPNFMASASEGSKNVALNRLCVNKSP